MWYKRTAGIAWKVHLLKSSALEAERTKFERSVEISLKYELMDCSRILTEWFVRYHWPESVKFYILISKNKHFVKRRLLRSHIKCQHTRSTQNIIKRTLLRSHIKRQHTRSTQNIIKRRLLRSHIKLQHTRSTNQNFPHIFLNFVFLSFSPRIFSTIFAYQVSSTIDAWQIF